MLADSRHCLCILKLSHFILCAVYGEISRIFRITWLSLAAWEANNHRIPSFSGSQTDVKQANPVSNGGLKLIYSSPSANHAYSYLGCLPNSASSLRILFKTPLSFLRSSFVCSDHKPDPLSSRRWRNGFEQRRGGSYDRFPLYLVSLDGRYGDRAVLIDSVARLSHEDGRICFVSIHTFRRFSNQ